MYFFIILNNEKDSYEIIILIKMIIELKYLYCILTIKCLKGIQNKEFGFDNLITRNCSKFQLINSNNSKLRKISIPTPPIVKNHEHLTYEKQK